VEIQSYRGFFTTGIKIVHSVSNFPKRMIFWPFSFSNLKRRMEALGYRLTGGN
jgi:hypothetical protein